MSAEAPRTYIKIALSRASLGDSEDVFAYFKTQNGGMVGHVPKKDITVDEQEVGPELSAKLSVKVLKSAPDYDLVEVQLEPGEIRELRVDHKTHEIIPIGSKKLYF